MPSELREALTAAQASALVPKIIDPVLLEYQRRYSPLVRMIPSEKWDSDTYYFNQRTQVANGGFVADGGARPASTSTYVQNSFTIRHFQNVGAVTGYAQAVTRMVIGDLRAREVDGSVRGTYWDIETAILWANQGATQLGPYPQFDGLDTLASSFSGTNQNAVDFAGATMSLAMLDQVIDMVEQNIAGAIFDNTWMFVMSQTAVSKIAQLLVAQQRYLEVTTDVGLLVPTYRGIPLVKSSFLSARSFSVGTVTTATATTTGSIPASTTFYYRVSAVIARQGEVQASEEVDQETGSGTATNTITLSFSTPTGLDGSQPILYKVYRGSATGAETLLGYVDATVGLDTDGVSPILTTSILDTGTTLVPKNGTTVPASFPATYQGTNAAMSPPVAGGESVYLVSRDQDNVVRPYVREMQPLDVYPTTSSPDTLPFAVVDDCTLALRAPKYVGRGYNWVPSLAGV